MDEGGMEERILTYAFMYARGRVFYCSSCLGMGIGKVAKV